MRIRWDEEKKIYPFAWHPNFSYNVIITYQSDPNAQSYLPEEQKALEQFVRKGGGLIIFGIPPKDETVANNWSLNALCKKFDAEIKTGHDIYRDKPYAVIEHSSAWKVTAKGNKGLPVAVSRKFGKGHIVIFGHNELLQANRRD